MVAHLETSDNVLAQDPDKRYVRDQMPWNPAMHAIPISGIRRMVNRAAELDDVIHLSIGQPDFPTPKHIIDAFVHALQAGQTGYTMDAGLPELLTALKDYYSERYRSTLSEDNFLITTGATEGIYLLLSGMAAPGREFIIADPTFLLYAPLIRMNGGQVRAIPTRASEGHQLDPERVISMIGPNTHAIVLNSPSNPTGTVYPRETIEWLCQEAAYRGIEIISDEVYDHLVLDDIEYPSVLASSVDLDRVSVVSSMSKTFAMAGLRVGWVVADQNTIRALRRFHMFTTTVASTPAQWAGVAALMGGQECVDEMLAEYRRRRDLVVDLVADTPGLTSYWPQGAFYIAPELPVGVDAANFAMRMLEETGICVVPGDSFGEHATNMLRISYSTSMDNIKEAFARMQPWMERQPELAGRG
ncbi:MAG TPA: aminotransferase class I/II-fold pyridoxal phosphate-dependent enzyme [Salinisphaeraceae bacterium]|nr:aminotransferase class I/II-fold pyridoxal phosphate-dependent enzyme [Salinisphaeraceae bacterium]